MRKATLIQTAIWDDQAFLALDPDARYTYLFLLTQPHVTLAGALMIRRRHWADRVFGGDRARLDAALGTLEDRSFVWVDQETEELVIRTWVRHNVAGASKLEKGALDHLTLLSSQHLRLLLQRTHPDIFGQPAETGKVESVSAQPGQTDTLSDTLSHRVSRKSDEVTGKRLEVRGSSNCSSVDERARARNGEWDALVAVFGYSPTSKAEKSQWGKLCVDLRTVEPHPPDVAAWLNEAARRYALDMPNVTMTPPALAKHASRLMAMRPEQLRSGRAMHQSERLLLEAREMQEHERNGGVGL